MAQLFEAAQSSIQQTIAKVGSSMKRASSCVQGTFEAAHSLEKRTAEAKRIRQKYPDRIPVIVERSKSTDAPDIDKQKYLVPSDLNLGQFVYVVRKRIKLQAEQAIFLFIDGTTPAASSLMSQVYHDHKNQDGFLYVVYSSESTFGTPSPQEQPHDDADGPESKAQQWTQLKEMVSEDGEEDDEDSSV